MRENSAVRTAQLEAIADRYMVRMAVRVRAGYAQQPRMDQRVIGELRTLFDAICAEKYAQAYSSTVLTSERNAFGRAPEWESELRDIEIEFNRELRDPRWSDDVVLATLIIKAELIK